MDHRKWATPAVIAVAILALLAGAALGYVRAGIYNIGADEPHYPSTYAMLEQLRDASIRTRATKLQPPADLLGEARIRQGAGNYEAMCAQCHLAPGMPPTELSRGLYPAPPNLSRETVDAATAFWTIKHGIKASGMPAWGRSMGDDYIWNMAAFLQRLPRLDAAGYHALVASSGGHSHGGGESGGHHHHDDAMHEHDAEDEHHDHVDEHDHDDASAASAATGTAPTHSHDADSRPQHVDPPGTPAHTH